MIINGQKTSQKCPFLWGDLGLSLIHGSLAARKCQLPTRSSPCLSIADASWSLYFTMSHRLSHSKTAPSQFRGGFGPLPSNVAINHGCVGPPESTAQTACCSAAFAGLTNVSDKHIDSGHVRQYMRMTVTDYLCVASLHSRSLFAEFHRK